MYSRQVDNVELTFGVSGLLYKSNVLMYDRQTESLWSQVLSQAVSGPMSGHTLQVLPSTLTTWEQWQQKHPETMVLSMETGYSRDYSKDPYADYYPRRSGLFGVFRGLFKGHEGKERVVGITLNGQPKAYSLDSLRQQGETSDQHAGEKIFFRFDNVSGALTVSREQGEIVPYIPTYWFVWKQIYPTSKRHQENQLQ